MPRYNYIWDVNIVLDYLKLLSPCSDIPLSHLTYKVLMLIALASSQRVQTLREIKIENIEFYDNMAVIPIYSLLKCTSVTKRKCSLLLKAYNDDPNLCVMTHIQEYLNRTIHLRKDSQLFISFAKPHNPVTTETISRWLRQVLEEAGIDSKVFKGHSTRAASCSNAKKYDTPIEEILKNAGWSNCETFHKFYDKVIIDNVR